MKRVDLIRRLSDEGCVFVRAGGRHVITGHAEAVPRHREIDERLARAIIERLSREENA